MEDINRKELLAIEAQLDARERFCMYAYMLLKENDSQAYFDAYIYSRPTLPKGNRELLTRKATEWINSEPCRAFVQLYETQADDEIDRRRKMIVNAPEIGRAHV